MAQGKKWHEDDDKALVASWIRASENDIRGADQSTTEFWDAEYTFFQAQKRPERSRKALRNRWSTVRHDVGKFVGVFSQAERNVRSGSSPDDILETALAVYKDRYGNDFQLFIAGMASDEAETYHKGQKQAKQEEVDKKIQRARELKRLDRNAKAMEEKNKILQHQMLLHYGPVNERERIIAELQAMVKSSQANNDSNDSNVDDVEVSFNESTLV
ncbi:hypothetical protein AeMF1_002037 [Aphanomyces euteiches]|nr:hypothetical protein AeMF1_002037 [Aphanomyces euteiches]KAH9182277.1 hypothetical protein AeNC1_015747 [Aphanomyces euteiches]